jgi:hypothetical protein
MSSLMRAFALGLLLSAFGIVVVAPTKSIARVWPDEIRQPSYYIIEGYLDRAPKDIQIHDRIDIVVGGKRRTLLVARYGTPGETGLDRYLSRIMAKPFGISGTPEEISSLAQAPAETRITGSFVAYTQGAPWLLIADLTEPASAS